MSKNKSSVPFVGFLFVIFAEFHRVVVFIHACISLVLDTANGLSGLMLGSSVFTDLKIYFKSFTPKFIKFLFLKVTLRYQSCTMWTESGTEKASALGR